MREEIKELRRQIAASLEGTGEADEEELLRQNEFFILRTARIATGRSVTKSDDEWSIALSAFWEAVKTHDPKKGTLQAYASVVIRHRLVDHARKLKKRERELMVEPAVFGGEAEEVSVSIQRAVERTLIQDAPETVSAICAYPCFRTQCWLQV